MRQVDADGALSGQHVELRPKGISQPLESDIEPWGLEAWDLFGHGRDGISLDLAQFVAKMSLLDD